MVSHQEKMNLSTQYLSKWPQKLKRANTDLLLPAHGSRNKCMANCTLMTPLSLMITGKWLHIGLLKCLRLKNQAEKLSRLFKNGY